MNAGNIDCSSFVVKVKLTHLLRAFDTDVRVVKRTKQSALKCSLKGELTHSLTNVIRILVELWSL